MLQPGAARKADALAQFVEGERWEELGEIDKAIEFYGTLLGLTVPPAPAPGPRPFGADPALLGMFGMPSAQLRFVTARIPGSIRTSPFIMIA